MFKILTVASMKMDVFWVVAPNSLAEVFRRFVCVCCLHYQSDEFQITVILVYDEGSKNL